MTNSRLQSLQKAWNQIPDLDKYTINQFNRILNINLPFLFSLTFRVTRTEFLSLNIVVLVDDAAVAKVTIACYGNMLILPWLPYMVDGCRLPWWSDIKSQIEIVVAL